MGELFIGEFPGTPQLLPKSDDIQIGEAVSFMVNGQMKTFEVMNKGVDISLRSIDLSMTAHVNYEAFRWQRNLLREQMPDEGIGFHTGK